MSGEHKDRGWARIPLLKGSQAGVGAVTERVAETVKDNSRLLCATFFPELERDDTGHADVVYLVPEFKFSLITNKQIHRAIARPGSFKAPSLDRIPNVMPISCADLLLSHLGPIR